MADAIFLLAKEKRSPKPPIEAKHALRSSTSEARARNQPVFTSAYSTPKPSQATYGLSTGLANRSNFLLETSNGVAHADEHFSQPLMSSDLEKKPDPIQITIWKKIMLLLVIGFFGATTFEYYRGEIEDPAGWLWPMLFIPLLLYLLGIVYGDVPARYYDLKTLKPFPVPFARQFDRCVLSINVLFTGLFLNIILLVLSLVLGAPTLLTVFYTLYMALMLAELPNSLRIFRFIQHVNTMQYVSAIHPDTFKRALAYYSPEQDDLIGESRNQYLKRLYDDLVAEANKLVVEESPLSKDQQIALNLAVRAGEAIRRSRLAKHEKTCDRLKANLNLLDALRDNAGLILPKDIIELHQDVDKALAAEDYE